jgi:hypothetical protein
VQVGQFILGKNLGIGAFGKVRKRPIVSSGGSLTLTSRSPLGLGTHPKTLELEFRGRFLTPTLPNCMANLFLMTSKAYSLHSDYPSD